LLAWQGLAPESDVDDVACEFTRLCNALQNVNRQNLCGIATLLGLRVEMTPTELSAKKGDWGTRKGTSANRYIFSKVSSLLALPYQVNPADSFGALRFASTRPTDYRADV